MNFLSTLFLSGGAQYYYYFYHKIPPSFPVTTASILMCFAIAELANIPKSRRLTQIVGSIAPKYEQEL